MHTKKEDALLRTNQIVEILYMITNFLTDCYLLLSIVGIFCSDYELVPGFFLSFLLSYSFRD